MSKANAQNANPPIFEADVLDEKGASFLNTSGVNNPIFTYPLNELLAYVERSTNKQNLEFSFKVGSLSVNLVLSSNRLNFDETEETKLSSAFTLKGSVKNLPDSKVCLTISPRYFNGKIVMNGKVYGIVNAKSKGKFTPNFFELSETIQAPKPKKFESTQEENVCPNVELNFGVQFDNAFAEEWRDTNGVLDLDGPRYFAFSTVDNEAYLIWKDIDPKINVYVVFEVMQPSNLIYPGGQQYGAFCTAINNAWQRPCIYKDGIIFFTGQNINVPGVTRAANYHCQNNLRGTGVSLISGISGNYNQDDMAFTTAHEIGHLIGIIGHEDDSDGCNQPCDDSLNLLMCSVNGRTAALSNCMTGVLNQLLNPTKCECLSESIPYYPTDVCPRCEAKVTSLANDNPNPIIGCALKSDIMNFSATIKGGCNAVSYPIRAKIPKGFAQVVLDQNGRFSDYFTHVNVNPLTGQIELVARKYPDSLPGNNNPEIIVDFLNQDTIKNINFKLRFAPTPLLVPDDFVLAVYMGNSMQEFGIREVEINPYFPITVLPGQTVLDVIDPTTNARFFQINGDLDFPFYTGPPLQGNPNYLYEFPLPGSSSGVTGYNFTDYHFIVGAGNKFHFNTDTKLKLINGSIEGCETMWAGIELEDGASIECVSSELKDAQWAIKLKGSAIADVRQTTFENNNYGFQALVPANFVPPSITLSGNKFITTGTIKAPYVGQAPLPFGGRGYAGVYVDRVPALNISSSGGMNSQFKNLHNGIIAYNSNLRVSHTFFEDILKVSGAPSLPGTIASPGKAIYARNGSLVVKGEGILAASPATFTNCHTAVEGLQTTLSVTENKMLSVNNGVSSRIGINKKVFISTNDIQAKDLGIGVFHALALPNGCQVNENTVRMIGNAQGVGIKTGGSGDFGQQEGLFSQNTIIVTDGAAGIDVGVSRNLKVINNLVNLNNGSSTYGIGISGGDLNGVNCNTINGVGQKGIYGIMAGRSNFVCNNASGTGIGLNFEGVFVGKGSIRVAGNTMNNNAGGGLLMGSDAVIGEQVHQGNKWTGAGFTIAQHLGGGNLPLKSKFIVDANENADFLPDFVNPFDWFENTPIPSTSYQCTPGNPDCPIVQSLPNYLREKEIAAGQLTGLSYQASQLWTAQRRLFERLTEEGNPYPGDTDISNFMAASQTNGLSTYADLQIGIRQVFQTSTADRSDLASYETQIEQGLGQLDQIEAQLNVPGLSQQDSINLAAQRNTQKQSLANLNNQRESILNNIVNARINASNSLYSLNNSLSGWGDYRVNEKTVNGIYLETVAVGNVTYSSTQLASLQLVAAQCPLSGGEAVLRARDMLALAQDAASYYNDAATCGSGARLGERLQDVVIDAKNLLRIYPNPAADEITIQYDLDNSEANTIAFFYLYGQWIFEANLPGAKGEIMTNVNQLSNGVYFYALNGVVSGRIIINN